jgi:uncharacterized membrane protein
MSVFPQDLSPVLSSIAFASESWGWTALALGAGALLVLFLSYRSSPLRGGTKFFALALKAIGLLLLALALMEPVQLDEQPKKNANDVAIVADNSSGLTISLSGEETKPADSVRKALTTDDPALFPDWLEKVGDTFRLQTFLFDRNLRRSDDYSDLEFEKPGSNLVAALDSIDKRFEKRPLAATVLFTDGNATDRDGWEEWLAKAGAKDDKVVPVFPVLIGEDNPDATDLSIYRVDAETTQFEDARVTLTIDARARGVFPKPVEVYVINDRKVELGKKEITFPQEAGEHSQPVRLRLAAIPPGVSFLTVGIRQVGENPVRELTEKNNSQRVVANPGSGPYRILYVSGRPNWEYKFLRRSIAGDAELDLVGLIRIAKREPKFEWRGRTGESSNPLFRGFKSDVPEETQKYDEPVLIRLNTATPEELRDGFPGVEETLFPNYRAIILDDIEADFFTLEQQELIERFVSRRGGTVIMLGGQESFQPGNWDNTPIGRLLPVYLEELGRGGPSLEASFNLTREGWLAPWMRLRASKEEEITRLAYMPAFFSMNQIRAIKPGASVLATVSDSEERTLPALITQRYGEGKAAAVTVADLWRWGMKDPEQQGELAKTWRQLLRWSVTEVPSRVELTKEEVDAGGLPLTKLSVRVRDETFAPQDDANVVLTITGESGETTQLNGEPSLEEPGLFTAEYASETSPGYRIEATVVDGDGVEVGTAEAARTFNPDALELARIGPDRKRLEQIAAATGGKVLGLEEIGDLPALLKKLELPVSEVRQRPLWHTPWLFLLALAFVLGEWILRRKQGIL